MPRPHERTRSRKRVTRTLPSGHDKIRYKKEVRTAPSCRLCGHLLTGFSHASASQASRLNRSKNKVWRSYGGQICHRCLKTALRQSVRTA